MDITDLYDVLSAIRENQSNLSDALWSINSKLTDIELKLDSIQGSGMYNQITDIVSGLEDVVSAINDLPRD